MDPPTFHLLPTGTEMRLAYIDAESHSSGDPDGLIRRPTAVIGGASSQSPECGAAVARKRA